jgi:Tol biopolymer transport system component/predicted Ser/Thr protein kinase
MTAQPSIGHYRIVSKLGEGGMGAVYRATDTKLNRDVAIKVLPEAFAQDAGRMARFEREARVLASLNDPGIAAIYGIEENAIVMELVEGVTLADRIARAPIPIEEALTLAKQVAEALEAAHEKGIIHRDLKPANVMVTAGGRIKVLDFGLAKAGEPTASSPDLTSSPTQSVRATEAGMIMGTAAYMSPEQAAGKPVDKRSDIWSFGVLLAEMLTGKRFFEGETLSHTLAHVLTGPIELDCLPDATPPPVRELIGRCLDRTLKNRLRDIGDARIVLQECLANPSAAPASVGPIAVRRGVLPWAAALAIAIVAGGIGWWRATRAPEPLARVRMNVEIAPDLAISRSNGIAISEDGTRLALLLQGADGKRRLYTRLLDRKELNPLPGTENAMAPFFSPDGRWIGFAADGRLKKISVEGGAPVPICEAPAVRANWGDDGNIVFVGLGGLWRVSSAGGVPAQLTKLSDAGWPQVLPGSKAVLYTSRTLSTNVDEANIEAFSLKTGQTKVVQRGGFSGRYIVTPDGGRFIYSHGGTLFAAPFDLDRLTLTGGAVPVTDGVYASLNGGSEFAVSRNGTVVYVPGKGQSAGTIQWIDQQGKLAPLLATPGDYYSPRFSPDGKRLAISVNRGSETAIVVKDIDREMPLRVSFLDGVNEYPVWSRDGQHIIFNSTSPKAPGLYWIRSDASGEPIRLSEGKLQEHPYSFSPDGKLLALTVRGVSGRANIAIATIEGDTGHPTLGTPKVFLATPYTEGFPTFSPDGHWLAYVTNESGTREVYVRPFPGPGGKWPISGSGGTNPVWSRDTAELLFSEANGRVMTVRYTAKGDSFNARKPEVWTEARVHGFLTVYGWDLSPEGKRLAAAEPDPDDLKPLTHLTLLLNFFEQSKSR